MSKWEYGCVGNQEAFRIVHEDRIVCRLIAHKNDVERIVKQLNEHAALKRGIERLEFLSHMQSGIPTTAEDRLCLIGEEADALLANTQESE